MDHLRAFVASGRALLRRPAYALLVVATLAIGIGGTTTIFTLVDGVLVEALPFEDADRIVTLDVTAVSTGFGISLSIPHYADWRERSRSFSSFGASAGTSYVRETGDGAEIVDARWALGDFFEVLGMRVALGRTLTAAETGPGAAPLAVLGHGFWERAFSSDPEVLGRTLVLDDEPFTVVGVLAPGQGYPRPDIDVYTPMGYHAENLPWDIRGSSFGTRALARLGPGVDVAAAQRDMNRVTAEVDAATGNDSRVTASVRTLDDLFLGDVRQGLWILMGAVALVLLIAGANVANLALARGEARLTELAVRRALGAGRREVVRLLLSESVWLSVVGGGLGVLLAYALVGALPSFLPLDLPALVSGRVGVDGRVLAFAAAVSVGAGMIFGLLPALQVARGTGALRDGTRGTGGRGSHRFRNALVVGQVALSVVLLAGAGLLLRSLGALSAVDKGFDDEDVLITRTAPPRGTFETDEAWLAFYDELLEAVRASPDVERAATTLLVPLSGSSWERRIRSEAGPEDVDEQPSFLFNLVSEDYFETMGIPVLQGRGFEPGDADGAQLVTIVDETLAERFWPGEDPIGRRVSWRGQADGSLEWRTVVGVARNTRHYEIRSASRIQAYVPMRQAGPDAGVGLRIAAKVRGDAAPVTQLVRSTVASLNPRIPVSEVRMLSDYVDDELAGNRSMSLVTGAFGVVAALLACLGIFGVLSLAVSRRAREIGVRIAIGATPRSVVRLVAGQGMAMAAVGAVVGVAAAALGGRVLESYLYQVEPLDPLVLLASVAVLLLAALIALTRPALKAAGTPPSRVLREE